MYKKLGTIYVHAALKILYLKANETVLLTIKGEVAKDGSEQIHDKHPKDGDVGDGLHASLCGTRSGKTTIIK